LNLGNLCLDRQQADAAFQHYQRASKLRPAWPPAILGMANSLIALGQHADAEAILNAEIAGGLRDRACLHLLAEIQHPRSASAALATLALDPAPDAETWALRAKLKTILLDNRGALNDMLRALAMDPQNDDYRRFVLFTSMLLDDVTPGQLMSWVRKRSLLEDRPLAPRPPLVGRRLKIGYLSCDYRRHAAAHYLYPVIQGHDATRFEVWMLSGTPQTDDWTQKFRQLPAHWLDLYNISANDARLAIERLQLDVLVECSGNTVDSLLHLLDVRLAPLQLATISGTLTSGSPTIDYRIVSKWTDLPGESEKYNCERLYYMNRLQAVYHPLSTIRPTAREKVAHAPLAIGFFNNATKLNRESIVDFERILEISNTRLLIVGVTHPETRDILQRALSRFAGRVEIRPRLGREQYLASIAEVDVAWDSYPYTGSTTTTDCLLSGVPVLSRYSNRAHSRSSLSLLQAVGLADWAFRTTEDQLRKLESLMIDRSPLAALRAQLPLRVQSSEIMDVPGFMREWENMILELTARTSTGVVR
jgi:tetratricopeptide (TPR) repeat protein